MNNFAYVRANDIDSALNLIRTRPKARFLAGGTNLLDLWKMGVEQPETVIDISRLGLTDIAPRFLAGRSWQALARSYAMRRPWVVI
jgi:xanthine dehydrogenase YagS FAD-binding subunit